MSLLGKPPDTTAMTVATGKNLDAIPRKVGSDGKQIFYFTTSVQNDACSFPHVYAYM